jgi:hypothetical protein
MGTSHATLTTDAHSLVAISFTINQTFSINTALLAKKIICYNSKIIGHILRLGVFSAKYSRLSALAVASSGLSLASCLHAG